jgi:hypothetical protein
MNFIEIQPEWEIPIIDSLKIAAQSEQRDLRLQHWRRADE